MKPIAEQVKNLARDLQLLQDDLKTDKDHLCRTQRAAESLGRAIQLLAKPSEAAKQRRSV